MRASQAPLQPQPSERRSSKIFSISRYANRPTMERRGLDTMQGKRSSEVRLAELTAALSIATDLGMGQPINYALCSSILAVRLGEKLKLSETDLRDVYYYALLRYIGCNAETPALAAIVGDEITMRRDIATVDNVRLNEIISVITHSIRQTHVDAS